MVREMSGDPPDRPQSVLSVRQASPKIEPTVSSNRRPRLAAKCGYKWIHTTLVCRLKAHLVSLRRLRRILPDKPATGFGFVEIKNQIIFLCILNLFRSIFEIYILSSFFYLKTFRSDASCITQSAIFKPLHLATSA